MEDGFEALPSAVQANVQSVDGDVEVLCELVVGPMFQVDHDQQFAIRVG